MHYELWDTESRNLLEDFDTEAEALEAARELIVLNPGVFPAALALARIEGPGCRTTVAVGADLATLARGDGAQPDRRSA
jgi:hypothetical protein